MTNLTNALTDVFFVQRFGQMTFLNIGDAPLFLTPYSLLLTPYSLLITHYSLLITYYPLLITHYFLVLC